MRRVALAPALAALALAAAMPAAAGAQRRARQTPPTGAEIAQKAKAARLDRENAVTSAFQGKKITFTPAALGPRHDLAMGQVIGVLENDVAGDETGLPPGRYNILAARLADGWHVYAEAGGQIVKEAIRVRLERHDGKTPENRPRFRAKGWGYDIDYWWDYEAPVATVRVAPTSDTALVGERTQFSATPRDSRGRILYDREVTWTSSNPAVATVTAEGIATGVGPGTASITATSEGRSGSATMTVPAPIYRATIMGSTPLYLGQPRVFEVSVSVTNIYAPPAIDPSRISWQSNNTAVVTVTPLNDGRGSATVTPVAEGSTEIRAVYGVPYQNVPGVMSVTVTRAPVASVTIAPALVSVVAGRYVDIAATVRDAANAIVTDTTVRWSSGDTGIAQVTVNGRVIGRRPGPTTVTATAAGVSGTAAVTVTPAPVATVTVTPDTSYVGVGQTKQFTATLRDDRGNELTGRTVEWATSEPAIADVTDYGLVLGIYGGFATITAMSEGKSGHGVAAVPAKSSPDPSPTPTTTTTLSFNW